MPAGDVGDTQNTGFNVNLALQFRPPLLPFGVRAEGMWNELGGDDSVVGDFADFRVIGGTANLLYELPFVVVRPYLIGGAGVYNTKLDVAGVDSRTNFGLNGGVGMYNSKIKFEGVDEGSTDFGINGGAGLKFSLGALETYAEARLHNIFGDGEGSSRIIPISFGILF